MRNHNTEAQHILTLLSSFIALPPAFYQIYFDIILIIIIRSIKWSPFGPHFEEDFVLEKTQLEAAANCPQRKRKLVETRNTGPTAKRGRPRKIISKSPMTHAEPEDSENSFFDDPDEADVLVQKIQLRAKRVLPLKRKITEAASAGPLPKRASKKISLTDCYCSICYRIRFSPCLTRKPKIP